VEVSGFSMIHNDINTWLEYKFSNMHRATPIQLFKQYLNSLALACEAKLNNNEQH